MKRHGRVTKKLFEPFELLAHTGSGDSVTRERVSGNRGKAWETEQTQKPTRANQQATGQAVLRNSDTSEARAEEGGDSDEENQADNVEEDESESSDEECCQEDDSLELLSDRGVGFFADTFARRKQESKSYGDGASEGNGCTQVMCGDLKLLESLWANKAMQTRLGRGEEHLQFLFEAEKRDKHARSMEKWQQKRISRMHRQREVDRLVEFNQKLGLDERTLQLSVVLFDRFVQHFRTTDIPVQNVSLVGVAAWNLACKFNLGKRISGLLCADFTADIFHNASMVRMERLMLATLDYKLSWVTPYDFLFEYGVLLGPGGGGGGEGHDLSHLPVFATSVFLLNLDLLCFRTQRFRPSVRAACALLLALDLQELPWTQTMATLTRCDADTLRGSPVYVEMQTQLAVMQRRTQWHVAVRTKFEQPRWLAVARSHSNSMSLEDMMMMKKTG